MSRSTSINTRIHARALVVLAITLTFLGLMPALSAHAVTPGRNGYIAFSLYNPGSPDGGLWEILGDGSGFKQIRKDAEPGNPAWSPNGQQIAYDNAHGILIVTAAGVLVRTVTSVGYNPTWSRNGRTIAFAIGNSLYKVAATGGKVTRLTTSPRTCRDSGPRWSPIAPSVVFVRYCNAPTPRTTIYTVNANTKALHLVTRDGAIDARDSVDSPDFMPNGKRISLTAQCTANGKCISGNNNIVTVDLNGANRVAVTHNRNCNDLAGFCDAYYNVQAAPDGRDFVYEFATNGGTCISALKSRANLCGGGPDLNGPDWQPLH